MDGLLALSRSPTPEQGFMRVVTAAEMRALEEESERLGVSTEQLMANAGLAIAQEAWLGLGTIDERRILVLVGPGNNGGDGLVAARHLHEWGARVACYLVSPRIDDPNLKAIEELGVETCSFEEDADEGQIDLTRLLAEAELVIDALLGTGRGRAIDVANPIAVILDQLRAARVRSFPPQLIAVDLPSGVSADGGQADLHAVAADVTVALGFSKVGLQALPGSALAGRVQVVDIGLPPIRPVTPATDVMTLRDVSAFLPERPADSNKGTFGRVMVAAGSRHYVGAAYLSTTGAMRAGAGLVTLACPDNVYPLLASRLVEATFQPMPSSPEGRFGPGAAAALAATLDGYDALLLGCGMGQSQETMAFERDLIFNLPRGGLRGLVIDADGLTNLAQMPGWWGRLAVPAVLTPHPGEFARLTGASVGEIQAARLDRARDAAMRWRQVLVLKGANTIVVSADGDAWISPFANPVLASAGTGDVLAGFVAGFIAQGLSPFRAATVAVYVHAAAGELLAKEMGSSGVLAGDLVAAIPRTVKEIRGE
ncbi:MAG: NAD(P)H-hydrate dehydratase [Dehalococcoidia bacterium]|nr:NAD(P)H-hydrate dehydratase [Dehalococcoidia bacterium]